MLGYYIYVLITLRHALDRKNISIAARARLRSPKLLYYKYSPEDGGMVESESPVDAGGSDEEGPAPELPGVPTAKVPWSQASCSGVNGEGAVAIIPTSDG